MKRLLTAMLLALVLSPAAWAASLAPHRALYDLKLAHANQGADLSSVEGRLAYELQGSSCEGWTVSFRMANRFAPVEGDVRTVDMQSTSYESGDFLDMRYASKEFLNGKLQAETRIKASREALGKAGSAEKDGADSAVAIPPEALFPMQHQIHLMDLAAKGESHDSSLIYDASDSEKVFRVVSFIGKRKDPGRNSQDSGNPEAKPLAGLASWPVSVSYYPAVGTEDVPDYQISFDIYENGVATGLTLDYGDFALKGTLTKLEMLDGESCN